MPNGRIGADHLGGTPVRTALSIPGKAIHQQERMTTGAEVGNA
jgi:hypothetical protein